MCLRYDRSQAQRKDFLHEAEILAKLEHENILHLYGVVLPGLYTDSIGLVSTIELIIVTFNVLFKEFDKYFPERT